LGSFFVLSGFILTLGCVGHDVNYGKFLLARILRIYLVCLMFTTAAQRDTLTFANLLLSLLPFGHLSGAVQGGLAGMFW